MSLIFSDVFVPFVFGALGFVVTFFMSRALNVALFGLLVYVIFRVLEYFSISIDWKGFDKVTLISTELLKALFAVASGILQSASSFALVLFICGGIAGLVLSQRGK